MKVFGYWTLFIALCVSAVAAYYSIIGLTAIFAAAILPIVIMGSVLEVAKITTAIWLHIFWHTAPFLMKSYLTAATIILMIITSMGIFGFLSKAHIEQTAKSTEGAAQVERIEKELKRADADVLRSEQTIVKLENKNDNTDTELQDKITVEENRITNLYVRLEIDIATTNRQLTETITPYESQRSEITTTLKLIQEYLGDNNVRKVQALIGVAPDGRYGPDTAAAVKLFREYQSEIRATALIQINKYRGDTSTEIARLRSNTESNVAQSNVLINRLRDKIGIDVPDDTAERIARERDRIKTAEEVRDELITERYGIEIENRKLEAEVGPVKYIAEMVYGENAGPDILEKAVRYVILMLVVVFDPLAIFLVLAGIMTISTAQPKHKDNNDENKLAEIDDNIEDILVKEDDITRDPNEEEDIADIEDVDGSIIESDIRDDSDISDVDSPSMDDDVATDIHDNIESENLTRKESSTFEPFRKMSRAYQVIRDRERAKADVGRIYKRDNE